MSWIVKVENRRAGLYHKSGLLKIVKYRNHPDCYIYGLKATFHCYYRQSVNKPFGYNVDQDKPFYRSLDEAKQAGENWLTKQQNSKESPCPK